MMILMISSLLELILRPFVHVRHRKTTMMTTTFVGGRVHGVASWVADVVQQDQGCCCLEGQGVAARVAVTVPDRTNWTGLIHPRTIMF